MMNHMLQGASRKNLTTLFRKSLATATFATKSAQTKKGVPWEENKILLTGSQGQVGVPLVKALCKEVGPENVIATDCSP